MSDNNEQLPTTLGIDEDEFVRESKANEQFSSRESVIPFTKVMQPLSDMSAPGAVPGSLVQMSNNRVIDGKTGVTIIPILHEWNYTEWVSRENGGGLGT